MKRQSLLLGLVLLATSLFAELKIEKLWEFSGIEGATGAKPAWFAADDGRSMVMKDGKLYIMIRTGSKILIVDTNASNIVDEMANPGTISLTGYNSTGTNCLSFTSDGQLLGGAYAGNTVKISKINLATGLATKLLEKAPDVNPGRTDFFCTYGDFSATGGDAYIIVPTNTVNLHVWKVVDGAIVSDVNPTYSFQRATAFGSSAMAIPKDGSSFYAMSTSTNPEVFSITGGVPTQFTTDGSTSVFNTPDGAGIATFELNSKQYFIRTNGRFGGMTFYDISSGYASVSKLSLSTPVLGSTPTNANSTLKVSIVTEKISEYQSNIYILVPNCGIAAYKFYDDAPPAPTTDIFTVGTGGTETFASFKAACDSINKHPFTKDVELRITTDLTEPVHVALGPNTNGYNLLIRPDKDEDRTVRFTQTADNGGPSGAICIGMTDKNVWTTLNTVTKNVIIDGYADGGTTKRLKFVTASNVHRYNGPFLIIGAPKNITIKNCVIEHGYSADPTQTTASYGINIRSRQQAIGGVTLNLACDSILIENNEIVNTGHIGAMGVGFSFVANDNKATNITIKDNTITARRRGILVNNAKDLEFIGNTFRTNQTVTNDGEQNDGIFLYQALSGKMLVDGNRFEQMATKSLIGLYGVNVSASAGETECIIVNNTFTGFNSTAARAVGVYGSPAAATTVKVLHNAFLLNEIEGAPALAGYSCINLTSGTPEIKNNIMISDVDNIANILISGTNGTRDGNLYFLRKTATGNAKINGTYADIAAYQKAVNKDVNSVYKDVTFVSATDLRLAASMDGDNGLSTARNASAATDIDGKERGIITYVGVNELTSVLAKKEISGQIREGVTYTYTGDAQVVAYDLTPVALPVTITYKQSGAEISPVNAGTYDIAIAFAGNEYYNSKEITGTMTIAKADQTITWDQEIVVPALSTPIDLAATASSGLEVSYTIVSGGSVAQISGNQLTFTKSGTVQIAAIQAGNNNYNAATAVNKEVICTITDLNLAEVQTVSIFPNPAREYIQIALPEQSGDIQLDIFDMSGKAVYKGMEQLNTPVSVSDLPAGNYVVVVRYEGQTFRSRLIINK